MKKLLAIALTALFLAAVLTPASSVFAACGSKHSGSKTAEQPKTGTSKA